MEMTFIYIDAPDIDLKNFSLDDFYTVTKELDDDDSITDIARDRAKRCTEHKMSNFKGKIINQFVYLSLNPIKGQNFYDSMLNYYFNEKNEVIFLDIFDNVKHNWKLKELKNLKEKGHIRNDISVVYIYVPKGMGAAAGAGSFLEVIINNLSNIMFQVFLALAVDYVKDNLKNLQYKLKYKDIQKIAEYWVNKQGIRSSRQLREFIINKGNWELNELAINLNISQEYAMILLESLGYELKDNQFVPSYSEEAIRRRKIWEEREKLQ